TKKLSLDASLGPDVRRIFPHGRSEHERIDATQYCDQGADARLKPMHVDVERQFRSRMPFLHGSQDFTHVAGQTRDSEQPRFLIQHRIDFMSLKLTLTHEMGQDTRIYRTGTCSHHQPFERSETHRRVNADAFQNCSERAAVAEMAGHQS